MFTINMVPQGLRQAMIGLSFLILLKIHRKVPLPQLYQSQGPSISEQRARLGAGLRSFSRFSCSAR